MRARARTLSVTVDPPSLSTHTASEHAARVTQGGQLELRHKQHIAYTSHTHRIHIAYTWHTHGICSPGRLANYHDSPLSKAETHLPYPTPRHTMAITTRRAAGAHRLVTGARAPSRHGIIERTPTTWPHAPHATWSPRSKHCTLDGSLPVGSGRHGARLPYTGSSITKTCSCSSVSN